ncbi:hypothetical protein GIB67_024322 [Kingdonia uniflora]|uniref:Uncharacterized protein n=1 Tax=Kingdonia uniflora TaxID=39325 RepID=A0A7J7LF99_9MAGN|nr:hypothetical protein GIB67_024322 [Kingdonia uniflora]
MALTHLLLVFSLFPLSLTTCISTNWYEPSPNIQKPIVEKPKLHVYSPKYGVESPVESKPSLEKPKVESYPKPYVPYTPKSTFEKPIETPKVEGKVEVGYNGYKSKPNSYSPKSEILKPEVGPIPKVHVPKPYSYSPKPEIKKPEVGPIPKVKVPKPYSYSPKPEIKKPEVGPLPKVEVPKPYSYSPKSDIKKPEVGPIPKFEVPKPYSYSPKPKIKKPEVGPKPKLEEPKTYSYSPKPEIEKPQVGEPKPSSYAPKPSSYSPIPSVGNPKVEEEKLYKTIGVQGIVYCKSGAKIVPLQGAVARVTCLTVDEEGYESAPFSVLSEKADEKGYFFATLCLSDLKKKSVITSCKVFLNSSSLETCNVPTDVNQGITGALPGSYHLLTHKSMKLFTVGPFVFTSETKYVGSGY